MRIRGKRGFTLIELLITVAIIAMMATAIVSAFAGGLRVYKRVQNHAGIWEDVLLSLEKMERDLRNVMDFSQINFDGGKDKISFAGLIKTIDAEGKQSTSLGRIYYYFDDLNDTLVREEQGYSEAVSKKIRKKKGIAKNLVSVEGIKFKYCYFDEDSMECAWKDTWELKEDEEEEATETTIEKEERIPLGVKIEVEFKDEGRTVKADRTVFIPISTWSFRPPS